MPTVTRTGPYRFFFWSQDCFEPYHVHVSRNSGLAKYWLEPVRLSQTMGFKRGELRRIERLVKKYEAEIIKKIHEHCD